MIMDPLRRMLVVANSDWFVANFMAPFLELHRRRAIEIHVGTPSGRHAQDLVRAGLPWHEIPMARGRGTVGDAIATARSLRECLVKTEPDLVHLITARAILLGALASRRDRSARFLHVLPGLGHAFSRRSLQTAPDRIAILSGVRWAANLPRRITIFHQASDRSVLLGTGPRAEQRSMIIPGWGVDLARFGGMRMEDSLPLVVMVARMLWTKGVGEFVRAAEKIRGRMPARFVLVGDPDPQNPGSVEASRLLEWNQAGLVEWWGHRDDVPDILSRASLVVLPSKYGEGVPQVLIEAAAAGVAVIASDIPGCREVVAEGSNGLLVPPGDAEALADAMTGLLSDPKRRATMGAAGREIVSRRFATQILVDSYSQAYERLGLRW